MKAKSWVLCFAFFWILLLPACASTELKKVRALEIAHVSLETLSDGTYLGEYSYSKNWIGVKVTIRNHSIKTILVQQNRDTKHSRKAEAVAAVILAEQRNDVDAISGATTTSKAILKAVEIALSGLPTK